jgi:hypothetical protein
MAAFVAALLATAAAASAFGVAHRVGGGGHDGFDRAAAKRFWTKQRMERATPLGVPQVAGDSQRATEAMRPTPRSSAGRGFIGARSTPPQEPTIGTGAKGRDRIHAPKFISGPVPPVQYATTPTRSNGRLLFTYRGKAFACSGTSVSSKSKSVVLTAGHCVHDKKLGWARHMVFVPAYFGGAAPYGVWPAKVEVAPRGWVKHAWFSQDYAALKIKRSAYGPLANFVGSEGLAWGQPRKQLYAVRGYPGNLGEGLVMWACISKAAGADPFYRGPGRPDTGVGCNMGHGASGGSWSVANRKGRSFVNSVTSFGYREKANILFGPYFTKKVSRLVKSTSKR